MDKFRFIKYRCLLLSAIVMVIIMAETISSHRYGRQKTRRESGLDIKKVEVPATVFELDFLNGLDLKKGESHDGIHNIKLFLATFVYLLHQK